MERVVKELIRLARLVDKPCREWWAVLGTVAVAFEGLGSWGLGIGGGAVGIDTDGLRIFLLCVLK